MPVLAKPITILYNFPPELRAHIWKVIYDDILTGIDDDTYLERVATWKGLILVSRLVCNEIINLWPRTVLPYHVDDRLEVCRNRLAQVPTGLSISQLHRLCQLNIQLPVRPDSIYTKVSQALVKLSEHLLALKITFVGNDYDGNATGFSICRFGVEPYLGSVLSTSEPSPVLGFEGDSHETKSLLLHAIQHLWKLRNLKLQNFNRPIWWSELGHKPNLKQLDVICDSRSQLYEYEAPGCYTGWTMPEGLEKLTIGANAALMAVRIVQLNMHALEELTYIIPAQGWQTQGLCNHFSTAMTILNKVACNGSRLRCLRLCFEAKPREWEAWTLVSTLTTCLPSTRLQYLELHVKLSARLLYENFIEALPSSLRHLHVCEEAISFKDLQNGIIDRYLSQREWDPSNFKTKYESAHEGSGYLERVSYPESQGKHFRFELQRLNFALIDRVRNAHLFNAYKDEWPTAFGGHQGSRQDSVGERALERACLSTNNDLEHLRFVEVGQKKCTDLVMTEQTTKWFRGREDWQYIIDAEETRSDPSKLKYRGYPTLKAFGRVDEQFSLGLLEVVRDDTKFAPYELLPEGPKPGCNRHWTV